MDHDDQATGAGTAALGAAASLEHLTGTARGTVSWLGSGIQEARLTASNAVHIADPADPADHQTLLARLHRLDDGYMAEAADGAVIWVNGKPVDRARLVNGDIIEFGERGPLSRFHLHRDGRNDDRSVTAILRDGFDYLRVSRQPLPRRLWRLGRVMARRLLRETTLLFRLAVLVAIAGLVWFEFQQSQLNARLEQALRSGETRLEQVTAALARARREALNMRDLQELRDEVGARLGSQTERLAALEKRSGASARIIAASATSTALLQGSYGFRDRASGRMLRLVLDGNGQPVITAFGQPLMTLEGNGPPLEIEYTGTAFALAGVPVLVSNRHVAKPWEDEQTPGAELEPVMRRFHAYFPNHTEPVNVELLRASDKADLALIKIVDAEIPKGVGLELSATPPKAGDEVIVLGYPTGLKALLVRSGEAFIAALQMAKETDFWTVAKRLAENNLIAPLASRGIVGQVGEAAVVYDADTTHGGSGGPVMDLSGRIVAINAAILPEFGGSNFGVPVALLISLLAEAGYE